ncbi:MAG: Hsp20/alpha crystallin family protein [Candidatus Eisenbacteria bacterium]
MTGESGTRKDAGVREMIEFLSRDDGAGGAEATGAEGLLWAPAADVYEADDTLFVTVEVAGMKSKEVHIRVEGGALVVRGERRPPHDRRERRYHSLEMRAGPFEKRIPLPAGYDWSRPRSRYVDGILEISFPCSGEGRNR